MRVKAKESADGNTTVELIDGDGVTTGPVPFEQFKAAAAAVIGAAGREEFNLETFEPGRVPQRVIGSCGAATRRPTTTRRRSVTQ